MALYNSRGNLRVTVSDTSLPFGIYAADGSLRVTSVDGTTRTGLYAADGSYNVVAVSATDTPVSIYHPCGALRGVAASSEIGLAAPNGAIYMDGLFVSTYTLVAATASYLVTGTAATLSHDDAPVLTLIEDGLEEAIPYYTFYSNVAGTLIWDFHSSITPPTAGAGDIATGTEAISSGVTVWDTDLSAYPGETGYLHYRISTSNILTSQQITVPGGIPANAIYDRAASAIVDRAASYILTR